MPKINILDRETAELIAAGEVIERPASVVKELVENSIDAGATAITVEIGHGGVRLIRVTDNGCGIEREDVPKAFLRHATSKVLRPEDLDRIGTLGFRGEALASICAVSETEILTRAATEEIGTRYTLAGECAGELAEAGCPVGTTITAKNLFYNVPARMKFLKKDSTEGTAVATLMDRLALSHPEITFKLIRDREVKLATPGSGDLLAAIFAVYGNEFGRGLIPVECESGPIRISGYLTHLTSVMIQLCPALFHQQSLCEKCYHHGGGGGKLPQSYHGGQVPGVYYQPGGRPFPGGCECPPGQAGSEAQR